jgi:hypothetical protein
MCSRCHCNSTATIAVSGLVPKNGYRRQRVGQPHPHPQLSLLRSKTDVPLAQVIGLKSQYVFLHPYAQRAHMIVDLGVPRSSRGSGTNLWWAHKSQKTDDAKPVGKLDACYQDHDHAYVVRKAALWRVSSDTGQLRRCSIRLRVRISFQCSAGRRRTPAVLPDL